MAHPLVTFNLEHNNTQWRDCATKLKMNNVWSRDQDLEIWHVRNSRSYQLWKFRNFKPQRFTSSLYLVAVLTEIRAAKRSPYVLLQSLFAWIITQHPLVWMTLVFPSFHDLCSTSRGCEAFKVLDRSSRDSGASVCFSPVHNYCCKRFVIVFSRRLLALSK